MTIDTNELRQNITTYGLEATCADDLIGLRDRLEAAESALSNLGVTPDEARDGLARHKATLARLEAAEKERDALRAAVQTEREACATICDIKWMAESYCGLTARACAEEIRARGEK